MFDTSKYYTYAKNLEKIKIATYIIYGIIGFLIGGTITATTKSGMYTVLGILIGLVIAYIRTINIKIRIQKMYWEIDMYSKMNKVSNELNK